jgi:hypothetical protein
MDDCGASGVCSCLAFQAILNNVFYAIIFNAWGMPVESAPAWHCSWNDKAAPCLHAVLLEVPPRAPGPKVRGDRWCGHVHAVSPRFCPRSAAPPRRTRKELRRDTFVVGDTIEWHGVRPHEPDWEEGSRLVALTLRAAAGRGIYAAFNTSHRPQLLQLPDWPGRSWQLVMDTGKVRESGSGSGASLGVDGASLGVWHHRRWRHTTSWSRTRCSLSARRRRRVPPSACGRLKAATPCCHGRPSSWRRSLRHRQPPCHTPLLGCRCWTSWRATARWLRSTATPSGAWGRPEVCAVLTTH